MEPGCPQPCPQDLDVLCPPKQSEDCLYINVYAPPNATDLPVMVFIYGWFLFSIFLFLFFFLANSQYCAVCCTYRQNKPRKKIAKLGKQTKMKNTKKIQKVDLILWVIRQTVCITGHNYQN